MLWRGGGGGLCGGGGGGGGERGDLVFIFFVVK
jgi:hypothetical protein